MDNHVNENNQQALAGSAIGVGSIDYSHNVIYPNRDKSLQAVGEKSFAAIGNSISSFTDEHRAPKYQLDADASYYGSGALSLMGRLGKLVFCKSVNDANRGAFRVNQSDSTFYSSAGQTTLGSTNIDTIDGWVINPVSLVFPSTNFAPTKPWIKKLFPTLSSTTFLTFAMLEIIQAALLEGLFGESKDYRITKNRKDLGAIIVDNQEIEDRLFKLRQGS